MIPVPKKIQPTHHLRHTAYRLICTSIGHRASIIHKYNKIRALGQIGHKSFYVSHSIARPDNAAIYAKSASGLT